MARFAIALQCTAAIQLRQKKQVAALVYSAVTMMDLYGDALAKVIYGFANPREAVEEAEK